MSISTDLLLFFGEEGVRRERGKITNYDAARSWDAQIAENRKPLGERRY